MTDERTDTPSAPIVPPAYLEAVGSLLALHRKLRTYSRSRSKTGISGKQVAVLRYLSDAGPQTVGALARYLFISEAATSELVGKLKAAGLVSRSRSQQDNRIVYVDASPLGRQTAIETPMGGIPLLREKMKELSEAELVQIADSIAKLVRLLETSDG